MSRSSKRDADGGGCLRALSAGRYLDVRMCKNMLAYKYAGEDKSFLYRFVLQPINAQAIKLVPMWMAPNLMSIIGLSVMVSAYLLTYAYSPNFDRELPGFVYLYSAVALFFYQTIDNLDGRQARRTGSSSPLGLLFDHGVDAANCTLASLLLAAVYQIGNLGPQWLFLFWNIGYVPFVFATWEEYFTGKLTLGEVNGPSDGMFLCMLFCLAGFARPGLYSATYAEALPALFKGTAVGAWPWNNVPLFLGYTGIVATVVGNAYQVSKHAPLLGRPLAKLFPFALLSFCSWSWVLLQPAFFAAHARTFCFAMGFFFCQSIMSMMSMHICDSDFAALRITQLPLLTVWFNCVAGPMLLPNLFPLIDPTLALNALLVVNACIWLHFVCNVILEITTLLHIRCFQIVPKAQTHDGSTPAVADAAHAAAAAAAAANGQVGAAAGSNNGAIHRKKSTS